MQADIVQITHLVLELLKKSSPQAAASLKQRLNSALIASGFDRFDEKLFGSKRFKDFLHKHFSATVSLELPKGPGDISVSLRHSSVDSVVAEPALDEFANSLEKRAVRPDVWQAFVNQDQERVRFLNKIDGKVVHFRDGEPADIKAAVAADPDNYIEIKPISADVQLEWLRAFLKKNPPNSRVAGAVDQLVNGNFGSTVIEGISHMLGTSAGDAWRARRTMLISSQIVQWCNDYNIDESMIFRPLRTSSTLPSAVGLSATEARSSVRRQAQVILDSLDDNDIAQIVLPILVSTVLVKARL